MKSGAQRDFADNIGLIVGVNFYDGQGFMVRKNSGINSVNDFKDGISCRSSFRAETNRSSRTGEQKY